MLRASAVAASGDAAPSPEAALVSPERARELLAAELEGRFTKAQALRIARSFRPG